ncbi:restriction endonuclease subunit S [Streptococcus sp. ZJ100]|uniref:restriction endonuclease subunit S n=1 Tax=Streptococcus handemini TaxID=3161188 RepID=UPI0032EDE587
MTKITKKIPKRRFKTFKNAEAWEQRKLGEVASYRRGSFPQPYGKSEWYGGEYAKPFVQVADVADSMCLVKDTKQKISLLAQPLSVFAEKGSVLVTLQGSIGRVAIIQYGAFIDRTILIFEKYKIDIDNVFWAYIIKQKFVEEALKAPGGTIKTITKEALSDFDLRLPNFEEQTQIGTFFFALDSLITLHQRKLDKLKNVKKAYLSELFPAEGEREPKRRFPGFTDAWEQRKLEALCELFTDGDWIEAKDQSNSGVRLVQTGNVGTAEYLDKENNKKWISEDTFEKLHCEEIYEGDILISRLPEPAGRACIMPNLGTRMITAVDCTIIRTAKEFDSKYLVQYLTTPMYFKVVNSFLGGGTRQRISRGNLSSIDIPIPSTLEEQKRIGQYFANLDNLITLHQRKLDKLKDLKKAYLNELFV